MRISLYPAFALLLACAFLVTAPVLAQEPGGDAPDGVDAAQNADGQPVIIGDFEEDGDVDCFAIYIADPLAFSATTENSPDRTVDTNLYLFEGTPSGATTGEAFNDDTPATPDLLSTIPVGALPGPNDAGPGKYVVCVSEWDVDPRNALGEDIFPNSPFEDLHYPNAPSGDFNLASWNPTLIGGDIGPYQIDLTGIGNNPGECVLKLKGEIMVNPNPAQPGDILQITGRVGNNGTAPTRASITIFYNRKVNGQPGNPMGSLRFEGNVPPGNFPFKIRVRVVPGAPLGLYNLRFVLEDKMTNQTCGTFESQLRIGPDVLAEGPTSTQAERAAVQTKADQDLRLATPVFSTLSTSLGVLADGAVTTSSRTTVTGVSPNPFASRTTISFGVDEAADVRLAVYDVLGREVAVLMDGRVESGMHTASFDPQGLAAGIYVYHLMVGDEVQTGRMTLTH